MLHYYKNSKHAEEMWQIFKYWEDLEIGREKPKRIIVQKYKSLEI